jgi:hypothetical protein
VSRLKLRIRRFLTPAHWCYIRQPITEQTQCGFFGIPRGLGFATAATSAAFFPQREQRSRGASALSVVDQPTRRQCFRLDVTRGPARLYAKPEAEKRRQGARIWCLADALREVSRPVIRTTSVSASDEYDSLDSALQTCRIRFSPVRSGYGAGGVRLCNPSREK